MDTKGTRGSESPRLLTTLSLSLHTAVPSSRHMQLLHILTGVCANPPVPIAERHLVFCTAAEPARAIAADEGGASQNVVDVGKAKRRAEREARQGSMNRGFIRYVEELDLTQARMSAGREHEGDGEGKVTGDKLLHSTWNRRFYDTPDPTVRAMVSRKSEILDVSDSVHNVAEAVKAAGDEGYRLATSYVVHGSRFVNKNIILLLSRIFIPHSRQDPPEAVNLHNPETQSDMKLLDGSGAYLLEARLEILNTPGETVNGDLVRQGMKEMSRFKEVMSGCVDLRTTDRMSMNMKTR